MSRPIIDFVFSDTKDPKYLSILDYSAYYQLANHPALFQITLPGTQNTVTYTVLKNQINVFNSVNLNLTCIDCNRDNYADLPDGIYTVNLLVTDTFQKKKYYLKTDKLRIDLDKIYIRVGIDFDIKDEKFLSWATEIEMNLTVAHSHVALGDIVKGKRYLDEVYSMLKIYQECKNCY